MLYLRGPIQKHYLSFNLIPFRQRGTFSSRVNHVTRQWARGSRLLNASPGQGWAPPIFTHSVERTVSLESTSSLFSIAFGGEEMLQGKKCFYLTMAVSSMSSTIRLPGFKFQVCPPHLCLLNLTFLIYKTNVIN